MIRVRLAAPSEGSSLNGDDNVYAPPAADLTTTPGLRAGVPVPPYRDPGIRARWAVAGLAASTAFAIAVYFANPTALNPNDLAHAMTLFALLVIVAVLSIGAVVAFCMWFHRVYANLPALGHATPRFTPGWAVGYFFIPILNLFRPYQAAREAWIRTEDALAGDTGGFAVERGAGLVGVWWALWIAMNLVSNFENMAPATSGGAADAAFLRSVQLVGVLLTTAATTAAIAMVLGLTGRQRKAAAKLGVDAR
ncbi:MAG TPA: DUF4328 domain-containing protein [Candidatus Polarisedimenticolaceae bacterium]